MTNTELISECKKGLDIQEATTEFDGVILQKILAVKSFMTWAGVSSSMLEDDLAVGVIVMGVTDMWNTEGGGVKVSPAFATLLSQSAISGNILTVASSPLDGAVSVSVAVEPTLTFNKRITGYSATLYKYTTKDSVTVTADLDITGKVLTVTPNSSLEAATKYAVVLEAVAYSGQTLGYTVIAFTTA